MAPREITLETISSMFECTLSFRMAVLAFSIRITTTITTQRNMNAKRTYFQYIAAAVVLSVCLLDAFSAPAESQGFSKAADLTSFEKPRWLTDLSLGVRESYDDNLYQAGTNLPLPASFTVPPGSVAARKVSSFVTTLSPKIGVDLAPLLGDQKTLQKFSLVYAPDFAFYHEQPTESHSAHHFTTTIDGKWSSVSFSADSVLTFINGSREGPTYPGGFLNAYSTSVPRDRREQLNDRAVVVLQYDHGKWFIRPTGSLLYYDMMTKFFDVTGYQNYVDRYDVNGGADLGYRFMPQLAVTLGYRYGHQYQEQLPFSPFSSTSDYQRVLFGIEGKPWNWLEVKLQGGPDFRNYEKDAPVNKRLETYYGEARLTATLTTKDTLSFVYNGFQFVSQLGQIPYFDSTYKLSYHRKMSDQLTLDLDGSILSSNYLKGNLPSSERLDLEYVFSARLGYSFNAHISAYLAYEFDAGRNGLAGVDDPNTRSFNRSLISIAVDCHY